jgi:hypothetical protein
MLLPRPRPAGAPGLPVAGQRGFELVGELRERLALSLCAGPEVGGGGGDGGDGGVDDVSGAPRLRVLELVGLQAVVDGGDEVDRVGGALLQRPLVVEVELRQVLGDEGRLVEGRWRSTASRCRCRARIRSPRTSSRARTRSRAASCATVGTSTGTISPSRSNRASSSASRASVLTRSPEGRCSFEGARPRTSPRGCAGAGQARSRSGRPRRSPRPDPATAAASPRPPRAAGTTAPARARPCRRPSRSRRPNGRAHPARHTYAHAPPGPPRNCWIGRPGSPRPATHDNLRARSRPELRHLHTV